MDYTATKFYNICEKTCIYMDCFNMNTLLVKSFFLKLKIDTSLASDLSKMVKLFKIVTLFRVA